MNGTPGVPDLPTPARHSPRRGEIRRAAPQTFPSGNGAASVLTGPPSPRALMAGLQRHLALALSLGLVLGSLTAAGVWFTYKIDSYSARALLRVLATTPTVMRTNSDILKDDTTISQYQVTQATLIKSRLVLSKALGYPKVAGLSVFKKEADPESWLAENLKINFAGEIMTISLSGNNPSEIVELVNAVTDAYLNEIVQNEQSERQQRYNSLRDLSAEYNRDLVTRHEKLRELARSTGSGDQDTVAFKQQIYLDQVNSTRRRLETIDFDLMQTRMQLGMLKPDAPLALLPDSDMRPIQEEQAEAVSKSGSAPPAARLCPRLRAWPRPSLPAPPRLKSRPQ